MYVLYTFINTFIKRGVYIYTYWCVCKQVGIIF